MNQHNIKIEALDYPVIDVLADIVETSLCLTQWKCLDIHKPNLLRDGSSSYPPQNCYLYLTDWSKLCRTWRVFVSTWSDISNTKLPITDESSAHVYQRKEKRK